MRFLAILYYISAYLMAFFMSIEKPIYLKCASIMLLCYFTFQLIDSNENS